MAPHLKLSPLLTTNVFTGLGGCRNKPGSLARSVASAGIFCRFAVVVALAHVDAVAMHQIRLGDGTLPVILHFSAHVFTGFRGHTNKPRSLARRVSAAGILCRFTIVMPFTYIYAITMHHIRRARCRHRPSVG